MDTDLDTDLDLDVSDSLDISDTSYTFDPSLYFITIVKHSDIFSAHTITPDQLTGDRLMNTLKIIPFNDIKMLENVEHNIVSSLNKYKKHMFAIDAQKAQMTSQLTNYINIL